MHSYNMRLRNETARRLASVRRIMCETPVDLSISDDRLASLSVSLFNLTSPTTMTKAPLSPDVLTALRASSTALCWKRAADLPTTLRVTQGTFKTPGEITLAYSTVFPPPNTSLRGVILFLHGVNEHSERYFHVFQALAEMGFGVLAYDLRSHGKSHMDVPNLIAHVDKFQEFIDDTNAFLTFAKQEIYPKMKVDVGLPLVIMGFSLGTLISIHTVLTQKHTIAGIVLGGPAVSAEMTWVLQAMTYVSGLMSALIPTARVVPGVNAKFVSRDPLVTADFDADPHTTREPITARMGAETLAFMTKLQQSETVEDANSAFCKLPILMMMGSEDKVTSLPLAQAFYERIQNADKHFEVIEGAYHVLFEDFERARVMHLLQEWLHQRFPIMSSKI